MNITKELQFWLDIPEETTTIEFKRLEGDRVVSKIMETIVAMANTDGGTIVLGVDDPEKTSRSGEQRVYGIEENIELFDEIRRKAAHIQPGLSLHWPPRLLVTNDTMRSVAVLYVSKSTQYLHEYEGQAYVRLRKGNKRLTAQECVQYSYAKGFQHADKELVDIPINVLETNVYKMWANSVGVSDRSIADALIATGLGRKNEQTDKTLPTRAAVMLFADFPSLVLDTKCAVRIFLYEGTVERFKDTPNLLRTPITIDGPTIDLIRRAQETVLDFLRTGVRVSSGFITTYILPERAIKEAITNAVIHRDYHIQRDIEVRIFEDRVEIESPGLLPYNITRANIGRVRADGYRNSLLVKHLRVFPSPPNLDHNEGVPAMRQVMSANNLYPPLFLIPDSRPAVMLILWNEERASEWEKVQQYLSNNLYINNHTARTVTGVVQVHEMSKKFAQWTKQGLLQRVPSDVRVKKGVKYRLSDISDERILLTGATANKQVDR